MRAPTQVDKPATGGADPAMEGAFKRELVGLIPHLRAFARTLAGDPTAADDLAKIQEQELAMGVSAAENVAGIG